MGRRGSIAIGGETLTKNDNGSKTPAVSRPLNETEQTLVSTLRSVGAINGTTGVPVDKLERRAHLKHGPTMHALQELERMGMVARVVGRKDVLFHIRASSA